MTDQAPSPPPPTATAAAPTLSLGPGFTAAPFAAGKYTAAIVRKLHGTHALQVLSEDSAASLVLDFTAGGAVTACRGWRYEARNRGPQVKTEDRYREQQGYRGSYVVRDGLAEVTLERDTDVCPPLFEGQLALARAAKLSLRCVSARATGELAAAAPLLLCQATSSAPAELEPFQVPALTPPGWFALAGGNGLLVRLTGRPPGARAGDEDQTKAALSEVPLDAGAWSKAL